MLHGKTDKPYSNMRSLNPYDFTIISANQLSIQAHFEFITDVNARQRVVKMHKSAHQRDILDLG